MEKEQEMLNPEAVAQFLADKGIVSMEQVENLVEPSLFVIIPMSIKERRDISANGKLLYGEIMALARRKGFCYATNQYIAERMGLARSSIPAILKELKDKNLIEVEVKRTGEGTYRRIMINTINYQTGEVVGNKGKEESLKVDMGGSQSGTGGVANEGCQKRYRQRDIDKENIREDKDSVLRNTLAKQSFANDISINDLIELFKDINPSYERLFPNKTQRSALERLVKRYGIEEVARIIKVLPSTNKEQFAPVITTPVQLENKLGSLASFLQRRQEERGKHKITRI